MFNIKTIRRALTAFAIIPLLAFSVACGEDPTPGNEPGNEDDPNNGGNDKVEEYEDIKVVDGKVRFYLKEKEDATRTATNMTARDWAKSSVQINGKAYKVAFTDEQTPRPYIEVAQADNYSATLLTTDSSKWYGEKSTDIKLPYSQFYHKAIANIKSFPMYASYSKENGNKLIFNDGFALVYVRLKGEPVNISSVKVVSPTGKAVAGLSTLSSKKEFSVKRGMDFAVLNCTNSIVRLSNSKYTNFRVMVAPGTYSQGLEISICDEDHGAMFITTEPLTLAAGDVHTIEANYEVEKDLIFYEGFDNFVWGGDIMKGAEGYGFAPTADKMGIDSGKELTGYEDAFTEVSYDNPGAGFVQSNNWDDVTGKNVERSHQLSDSYIKSCNLVKYSHLFRSQERPGYVVIGEGNRARGIMCTPMAKYMKGIGEAKTIMQFAVEAKFSKNLTINIVHSGIIKSVKLDGKEYNLSDFNCHVSGSGCSLTIPNSQLKIASSAAEPKTWQTLEWVTDGITDGSKFYVNTDDASTGEHGIYVDYIKSYKVSDWGDTSNLKVLYWNIQNGMIADQHNKYENFVAWVKKWDPDICVWCESETIYKDKSGTGTSNKFLPDGWGQVAARYGHQHVAVGGNHDNYPQTITSKYPIKTVKKITNTHISGKPVAHGAGHFQVEVNGKNINVVTLHMWPAGHAYGASNTTESAAAKEGDYYRQFEMQYIVDNTVNLEANKGEDYWILCGDTNSYSRMDDWSSKLSQTDPTKLITHDVILEQTYLKDVIAHRDCYGEKNNVMFRCRIDFIYTSPKMFDCLTNSIMLMDSWSGPNGKWEYHTSFSDPSDHTPVYAEFKF